jgi:hypothetical protein
MATNVRIQYLLIIDKLQKRSVLGFADITDIQKAMLKQRGSDAGTVRVMMHRLFTDGYVDRPFHGCYELTANSVELLNDYWEEVNTVGPEN